MVTATFWVTSNPEQGRLLQAVSMADFRLSEKKLVLSKKVEAFKGVLTLIKSGLDAASNVSHHDFLERRLVLIVPQAHAEIKLVVGAYLVYPPVMRTVRRCINSTDHATYISALFQHQKEYAQMLTEIIETVHVLERIQSELRTDMCHVRFRGVSTPISTACN